MNCVGIDVSKGKSMIAVMRPFGEVVISPFEVQHTASELASWQSCSKAWTARPVWSWNPRAITIHQWLGCSTMQGFMSP